MSDFIPLDALIRQTAEAVPSRIAVIEGNDQISYGELNAEMDRVAAALQRSGLQPRDRIAICALSSIPYVLTFLGAIRAGIAVAPMAPSSTPADFSAMVRDAGAKILFMDDSTVASMETAVIDAAVKRVALDGGAAGEAFKSWSAEAAPFVPVEIDPEWVLNIIYSSGTTGTPKGIIHTHQMRFRQYGRNDPLGYGEHAVSILSTPLYSNTTLVCFNPTLAGGGTLVLMRKFDARGFLELAEKHRATHVMLVPVQYRRIMAQEDFDKYDLSSFVMKYSTSAPFGAALKRDILDRWPGGLTEFYGMTEGGGSCMLLAHEHPDKLHTVGQPAPDHEIRLIDEEGHDVPQGEIGEVIGHSAVIMQGYLNQPQKTAETIWRDPNNGKLYVRTGDVGRFDADGFLTLMDRKKDMIISGGFNIYPSDIEAVLATHDDVHEVAVVAMPSEEWGETPAAFIVRNANAQQSEDALKDWVNSRVGKFQRVREVVFVETLPRSAIGKVLKRELRDSYLAKLLAS